MDQAYIKYLELFNEVSYSHIKALEEEKEELLNKIEILDKKIWENIAMESIKKVQIIDNIDLIKDVFNGNGGRFAVYRTNM